jgi:hypothetical protein
VSGGKKFEHADALLNCFLDQDIFEDVLKNSDALDLVYLFEAVEKHPDRARAVIARLLENKKLFKYLFENIVDLVNATRLHPNQAHTLILHLLEDKDLFKHVMNNTFSLCWAVQHYPGDTKDIMHFVLSNEDIFKYVASVSNLVYLLEASESHRVYARGIPVYSRIIIQRVLKDKALFKHLVKDIFNLCEAVEKIPDLTKEIMHIFLCNEEIFKDVIKTKAGLDCLEEYFPDYAPIFNKASVEKAYEAAQCYLEISKNSILLAQAKRTQTSFFNCSPFEILEKIVICTVDSNVFDPKQAAYFTKSFFKLSKEDAMEAMNAMPNHTFC